MKQHHKKEKEEQRKVALERIIYLFAKAKDESKKRMDLSDRYVQLALKISMKSKVRVPRQLKRMYCKHCFSYLLPGKTSKVRAHQGKIVIHCLRCSGIMRVPYIREKKERMQKKKKQLSDSRSAR